MGRILGVALEAGEMYMTGGAKALEIFAGAELLSGVLNKPPTFAGAPVTLPAEGSPIPVIYGRVLLGGTMVYAAITQEHGGGGKGGK